MGGGGVITGIQYGIIKGFYAYSVKLHKLWNQAQGTCLKDNECASLVWVRIRNSDQIARIMAHQRPSKEPLNPGQSL